MINQLYTLTSKEHFNKYKNLQKGVNKETLLSFVRGLYKDKESLQTLFNLDENLNNISMREIDAREPQTRQLIKENIKYIKDGVTYISLSMAESCCFIKHILIYDVLGIKPFFEEDIKNYKELWLIWRDSQDNKTLKLSPTRYILSIKDKWIFNTQ